MCRHVRACACVCVCVCVFMCLCMCVCLSVCPICVTHHGVVPHVGQVDGLVAETVVELALHLRMVLYCVVLCCW